MPTYRSVPRKVAVVVKPEAKPDLSGLKKDELVALADKSGVDSAGTKADILARLDR